MIQVGDRHNPGVTRFRQRRSAGFTLIELVAVITVVSVLAAVALNRLLYYQERAEKTVMDGTLAAIKMGLQIRLAELMMTNRQMLATDLERKNPTRWLTEPPEGYAGEYAAAPSAGSWYFDSRERELVYVPKSRFYLEFGGPNEELRFRVALRYGSNGAGGAATPDGVTLVPTHAYKWF